MNLPLTYPVIFIRDLIPVPNSSLELWIGRDFTIETLTHVENSEDGLVVVCAQRDASLQDQPTFADIYTVGTLCKLEKMIAFQDGPRRVYLSTSDRFEIHSISQDGNIPVATGQTKKTLTRLASEGERTAIVEPLKAWNKFKSRESETEILAQLDIETDLARLTDLVLRMIAFEGKYTERAEPHPEPLKLKKAIERRQAVLEEDDAELRYSKLRALIQDELIQA